MGVDKVLVLGPRDAWRLSEPLLSGFQSALHWIRAQIAHAQGLTHDMTILDTSH